MIEGIPFSYIGPVRVGLWNKSWGVFQDPVLYSKSQSLGPAAAGNFWGWEERKAKEDYNALYEYEASSIVLYLHIMAQYSIICVQELKPMVGEDVSLITDGITSCKGPDWNLEALNRGVQKGIPAGTRKYIFLSLHSC